MRPARTIAVLGRRGPTVTAAQAEVFLTTLAAQAAADAPEARVRTAWRSERLPDSVTGPTGRALLGTLLGLSGCVLLVACSNLANLLLARAINRTREFAVRTALGASRLQLIRTVLLESALVAAAGGIGAVLVAAGATQWLRSIIIDGGGPPIPMDWHVLAFAAVVSLATVVFCGVAPALFTRRIAPNDTLKSGGRGSTDARGHVRTRHVFLVGQFALAPVPGSRRLVLPSWSRPDAVAGVRLAR